MSYSSNGGTSTNEAAPDSMREDYSIPLYDEVNGMPDLPDTIPWCPEDDPTGVVPMHGAGMDSIVPKSHRLPAVAYGSFTWTGVGGTSVDQGVGFPVNAVIVHNTTAQWLKVGHYLFIPPYSLNGVFKFPSAIYQASVTWEAPAGFTQPVSVSGQYAIVQFCEEPLHPVALTLIPSTQHP